jgi:prepilin-type N-terminal cleavage/methylation domain-containing protein
MSRRRFHGRRGFTLVEMIAAITVIAAMGSVSSALLYTAIRTYRDGTVRAQLQEEASTALDRLTRAFWSIPRDTTAGVVAPQVSSVTATSINFSTNWVLTLTGSQLMLTESGGTAYPILNDVTSFAVAVYDESNAAIGLPCSGASTQAIRRIQLTITTTRGSVINTIRTKVFIRSTMAGAAIG